MSKFGGNCIFARQVEFVFHLVHHLDQSQCREYHSRTETMSPTNLTPSSLLELALTLLPSPTSPNSTKDASSTSPSILLETPHQLLSLLLHSIHTATGFRTTPSSENEAVPNQLKEGWNAGKSIQFQYRHDQSSLEFIVSCLEMGNRGMCVGVAVEVSLGFLFGIWELAGWFEGI